MRQAFLGITRSHKGCSGIFVSFHLPASSPETFVCHPPWWQEGLPPPCGLTSMLAVDELGGGGFQDACREAFCICRRLEPVCGGCQHALPSVLSRLCHSPAKVSESEY